MSAADNRGDAIADELRRSGEELARLAEGLGTTPREIEAFFSAAARHMAVLTEASLIDQAFATGVMALLTAFGHRFSPRDCAAPYLSMLLRVAVAGALAQQQAALSSDSFAMEHFEAIDAELGPLHWLHIASSRATRCCRHSSPSRIRNLQPGSMPAPCFRDRPSARPWQWISSTTSPHASKQ